MGQQYNFNEGQTKAVKIADGRDLRLCLLHQGQGGPIKRVISWANVCDLILSIPFTKKR